MRYHEPPAMTVNVPGQCHHAELHGLPQAGDTYLRNGVPVGEVFLGDAPEGTAYHERPRLAGMTLAELDELLYAFQIERARVAMWFTDHQESA